MTLPTACRRSITSPQRTRYDAKYHYERSTSYHISYTAQEPDSGNKAYLPNPERNGLTSRVANGKLTRRPSPFQAIVGTPADWAMIVEPILSPRALIGGPEGLYVFRARFDGRDGQCVLCGKVTRSAKGTERIWKREEVCSFTEGASSSMQHQHSPEKPNLL